MAFSPVGSRAIFRQVEVPEDHIGGPAIRAVHRPGIADDYRVAGIAVPAGGNQGPNAAGVDGGIPHRRHQIGAVMGKAKPRLIGRVAHRGGDHGPVDGQNQGLLHIHSPFRQSRAERSALVSVYAPVQRQVCCPGGDLF